jgi:tetratricopeptide (TPR) repeat protein/tRNA A-37 threonylcarbamoyl transferase component Bud32
VGGQTHPAGLGETEPGTLGDDQVELEQTPERMAPRIGRFSILRKVGAGGMGVVYAGYDEELDRKVAIKLLHRRTGARARTRLLREAQGLARLSHPNVVQVYEIGEHDEATFIAMEFVEGQTLAQLRAARPEAEWPALLAIMLEAGRGLAAAHDKGLVHRDFKPDNVMIDIEGRVRVMDFGLVHGGGGEIEDSWDSHDANKPMHVSGSALSHQLTQTGVLLGTPAYMAPEQLGGVTADARSDQFGFCIALWELLYGERPFGGETLAQLCIEVTGGHMREPPRGTEVPVWLRKVIERGLAINPEQRWPSMAALLDALSHDPTRGRRRVAAAVIALALLLAGLAARQLASKAERERIAASCEAEGQAIAEVWNPELAAALERAFVATELSFAADSWARTHVVLDGYASEWSQLQQDNCLDTELDRGRPSASRIAMAGCLAEARVALAATVEVLATVDAPMAARAVSLALELPPLQACVDEHALARRSTPPAEVVRALEQHRVSLEQARVLQLSTRYDEALARATAVADAAVQLKFAPWEAEARLLVGAIEHELGDYGKAEASVRRAFTLAAESEADALALRAATRLTRVVGYDQARHGEGLLWGELGQVFVVRLGLQDSVDEALLLNEIATVASEAGDYERALTNYQRALALLEQQLGPMHPDVARVAHNLGSEHLTHDRHAQAQLLLERALSIREQLFGPNHPLVADSLANLGSVQDKLGHPERAAEYHLRALAIREVSFEPMHPRIASSLLALGNVAMARGKYDEAIARFESALAIREHVYGPKHPRVATVLDNLGAAYAMDEQPEIALGYFERSLAILAESSGTESRAYANALANIASLHADAGRFEQAEAELEQARAIFEALLGPESREVAVALRSRGNLERVRERPREALRYLERAHELLVAGLGEDHIEVGTTLFEIGSAQLQLEQYPAAVASLERALELEIAAESGASILADTRLQLASALWGVGEHERAREQAQAAREGFAEAGLGELAVAVEEWLGTH